MKRNSFRNRKIGIVFSNRVLNIIKLSATNSFSDRNDKLKYFNQVKSASIDFAAIKVEENDFEII